MILLSTLLYIPKQVAFICCTLWLWLSSLFTLHILQNYNYLSSCTMDVKALFCSSPVQMHHLLLPFEITFFCSVERLENMFYMK
ncbi:hypothetical protein ANANG_G00220130 [Anguilla anguilla]|uniref:Uncharacterized protein n=1 Tax=Anguilla anguilla TaxID=7936 RepID=A0A9D3RPH0_ANGAN|nr:hypothetical protein ANANG_G00220130 [Anguilla anguilla]